MNYGTNIILTKNIMAKKKSKGLERQDNFIKTITGQDFDFGLVMTQAFLKGIRDIGYKSTATALFESFDNSIQAEASNIYLLFEKGKTDKSSPSRIAIVDDGHGMSKEMIRIAVLWGGSDRLDDRQGMGKYGYGLPSSCVSIGQQFTVISKREDSDAWYSVTIDIEAIAKRSPDYIDPKTGRVVAPEAKTSSIPDFVQKFLDKEEISMSSGTIVLIDKIDRLSRNSPKALKAFLSLETGITYRNYLRSTNIYIDGELIEPVDPLFITEGFRFFDEGELKPRALPSSDIAVTNSTDPKKTGSVKIRYASFPYGYFSAKEKPDEDTPDHGEEVDDITNDQGKKDKSKRLTVRKNNNGIIFLRNGRQIDVVDSKIPWTKIQNNDRFWAVEVDFSPELDEEFSITTSKQQIVVSPRMWNILYDAGVLSAIQQMRRTYIKEKAEADAKKQQGISEEPEKRDEFAENVMAEAAKDFEIDKDSQPGHVKKEGQENLERKAKKISEDTGIPEDVVKQQLEVQTESRPFKIEYFDQEESPFYRAEQVGGQITIYINRGHRFYTDLYNNPKTNAFTKNALAMIVFVLGYSELRVTEERRKMYKIERNEWSVKLDASLEALSKHFSQSIDDHVSEEELFASEPEAPKVQANH
jgi:hypothetical protein